MFLLATLRSLWEIKAFFPFILLFPTNGLLTLRKNVYWCSHLITYKFDIDLKHTCSSKIKWNNKVLNNTIKYCFLHNSTCHPSSLIVNRGQYCMPIAIYVHFLKPHCTFMFALMHGQTSANMTKPGPSFQL